MKRLALWVNFFLLIALPTSLAVLCAAPPEPAAPPEFQAVVAEGKPRQGALRELTKDWSVKLGQAEDAVVQGSNLVALRRVGVALPDLPDEAYLILVNGDRVPVSNPHLVGERLQFRHADLGDGKEVQAPMSALALLWLETPVNVENAEQFRRKLLAGPRKRDRVLLINGDAVEGDLGGLADGKVVVEDGKKKSTLDLKQVSAIVLSTELAETVKPQGVRARAVLLPSGRTQSSRLTLTSVRSDGSTLEGVTTFGATLKVPVERLAALDLFGGRATYLSDLKPSKYEFQPYLDLRWPLVTDGSVAGGELRVGSSVYTKGLGMHAHSRVTYTLAGGYRRFEALVGLDSKLGRQGSARIRVLADGKPLTPNGAAEGQLSERRPTLDIDVSVEGVKELTLEADFGTRGDVGAHVNWVDARLIK